MPNLITDPTSVKNLDDLAAKIRNAHAAVGHAARDVLEHALNAGDALLKAKAAVPHGRWLPWLKSECDLSDRHAERYMLLAQNRVTLAANSTRVSDLSLRSALCLLKKPSKLEMSSSAKPPKKTKSATSLDALGWWSTASLEERRHFLDGVGLRSLFEVRPAAWGPGLLLTAIPDDWRRELERRVLGNLEAHAPPKARETIHKLRRPQSLMIEGTATPVT
jgi:hypothetical protein